MLNNLDPGTERIPQALPATAGGLPTGNPVTPATGPSRDQSAANKPGPTADPTFGPTTAPTTGPSSGASRGPTPGSTSGPTPGTTAGPTPGTTAGPTGKPTSKPTGKPTGTFPPDQTTGNIRIYYNSSRGDHIARSATLISQGFRPTSLSLSAGERYTTVWVKQSGPDLRTFAGLGPDATKRFIGKTMAAGYRLKLIVGLGPVTHATYAGTLVKQDAAPYNASFWRMTKAQFRDNLRVYGDRGRYTLRWVSAYGPPGERRYAAVWEPNVDTAEWTATVDLTWTKHQQTVDRMRAQGFRPTLVTGTTDRHYTAVWRKESTPYVHYGDLTPDAYRTKLAQLTPKGYYPSALQLTGTAQDPHLTAIWSPR